MESQRPESLKMEDKNVGGRPPNIKVKVMLRGILKELSVADVDLARKRFTELTGKPANYHTIKKYLDQLVEEDYLRMQVVQDNLRKIEQGSSHVRRRVFLYQVNQNFHTIDKVEN